MLYPQPLPPPPPRARARALIVRRSRSPHATAQPAGMRIPLCFGRPSLHEHARMARAYAHTHTSARTAYGPDLGSASGSDGYNAPFDADAPAIVCRPPQPPPLRSVRAPRRVFGCAWVNVTRVWGGVKEQRGAEVGAIHRSPP